MGVAKSDTRPLYDGLRVTPEEYLELEEDGFKYVMIDGVLHFVPSGTPDHGRAQFTFAYFVMDYLRRNPVGRLSGETDIYLPDGGDIIRPDVTVVLNANLSIVQRKIIRGVPNLVCEVLSDRTAKRDVTDKSRRYLNNGVSEYWLINPPQRAASHFAKLEVRYRTAEDEWEVVRGDALESRVLPGFVLQAQELQL